MDSFTLPVYLTSRTTSQDNVLRIDWASQEEQMDLGGNIYWMDSCPIDGPEHLVLEHLDLEHLDLEHEGGHEVDLNFSKTLQTEFPLLCYRTPNFSIANVVKVDPDDLSANGANAIMHRRTQTYQKMRSAAAATIDKETSVGSVATGGITVSENPLIREPGVTVFADDGSVLSSHDASLSSPKEVRHQCDVRTCRLVTTAAMDALQDSLRDAELLKKWKMHLIQIGGKSVKHYLRRALDHLMTVELATEYSWDGRRRGKRAFRELVVCDVLIDSCLRSNFGHVDIIEIQEIIKNWLKIRNYARPKVDTAAARTPRLELKNGKSTSSKYKFRSGSCRSSFHN